MEIFLPDKYYKNIYEINYRQLKQDGIKCLLFDLDNTLVPPHINKPNKKIRDLFDNLKEFSNYEIIFDDFMKRDIISDIDFSYENLYI